MGTKKSIDPQRTVAWPAGKSIEEPTSNLAAAAGIRLKLPHPRSSIGAISGLPGFDTAIRLKPSLVCEAVEKGVVVAGITGLDNVIEGGMQGKVNVVAMLAYSKTTNGGTRGVLFGRNDSPRTLDELRRQRGVRIVSEYPQTTKAFLAAENINAEVISCPGGAEALVASGLYDFGVALVETGSSLTADDLISVAQIFESQTVLIAHADLYACENVRRRVDFFAKLLLGVIEARDKRYLTMNAPLGRLDQIRRVLPALKSPTVQALAEEGYCAISTVVPVEGINDLKMQLLELGATGIVELNASSII